MYLKQLTIAGFKSFAKSGELEFDAPITAIVGPNGSGKSNVAESFRFVLGEQSPSRMRGKKGEDLIWGGTDRIARSNRASVALTLNNDRRVFPVDFDEVTVERTVHRDGQNEYAINGSKVRLKDVQELLAAANIGSTGHHIISQGEADRILLANPKERREMIEDALGLKVYQYKKTEAEKKLKKTRENIERVESLRREVAPHLKFLERQIKKIERAVQLRESLKTAYAEYLRREDLYLAHQYDRLQKAKRAPAERLNVLATEHADAKRTLEEAGEDEKRAALVQAEEELSRTRNEHQALLRTDGQLEGQIGFVEKRIAAVRASANEDTHSSVPYDQLETVVTDIERAAERMSAEHDVSAVRRAFTDAVRSLRTLLTRATTTRTVSTEAEEEELRALQEQKQQNDKALADARTQEEAMQKRYDDVRAAIESEMNESREAERELFRIVGEQRECEAQLSAIEHELAAIERDRDEFKRELQEAVTLVGRAATEYLNTTITVNGEPVSERDIVSEDREKQRNRRRELEKMKIRLEELGGANDDIEKEYRGVKERDDFLVREVADLEASVEKLEELIVDLTQKLDTQFVAGIDKIAVEFNRFFTLMFGGGEARLLRVKPKVRKQKADDLDDDMNTDLPDQEQEDEEAAEGIELDVKLPNKRVRGLDMLSGGERALTSIALIFAMSQVNPPLFIILDETDAALDEANSRRYGDMIEALAKKSQLILITHNRETMRRAGILYGVTMASDGVSKLLSVKLEDAVVVAK